MPARMPLFPLATALFPGTPLPLRIFEPRYRIRVKRVRRRARGKGKGHVHPNVTAG